MGFETFALYYEHITIINDASRVTLEVEHCGERKIASAIK
jgi:hypothetical protein